MPKHRLLIVGAGRIGAAFRWHDSAYTHAGAARMLHDRVELVGFVEPNPERADEAERKWNATAYESLQEGLTSSQPDIVSVCVQPEDQIAVMAALEHADMVRGIWCEKPYMGFPSKKRVQVNYLRRADARHQAIAAESGRARKLIVYGKDDIHTRCHFEDLRKWWECELDYRVFNGPCAYALVYPHAGEDAFFDNGGLRDPGHCMARMLGNLLNVLDGYENKLWSPADAA